MVTSLFASQPSTSEAAIVMEQGGAAPQFGASQVVFKMHEGSLMSWISIECGFPSPKISV